MTKTDKQIQQDFYNLLKGSVLHSFVTGNVYKYGLRPRDSKLEDIDVKFIAGLDADLQSGIVNIRIFVPDITISNDGVCVENISRCQEVEIKANEWVKSLTLLVTDYKIKLLNTITTEEEPEINQHFIAVRINFQLLTL